MAIQWFELKRAIALRLYDLGIILYGASIRLLAWWQPKAAQWVAGRKAQQYPLIIHDNPTHTPRFWVHCASLGEAGLNMNGGKIGFNVSSTEKWLLPLVFEIRR